jgi:hypothetical protein
MYLEDSRLYRLYREINTYRPPRTSISSAVVSLSNLSVVIVFIFTLYNLDC